MGGKTCSRSTSVPGALDSGSAVTSPCGGTKTSLSEPLSHVHSLFTACAASTTAGIKFPGATLTRPQTVELLAKRITPRGVLTDRTPNVLVHPCVSKSMSPAILGCRLGQPKCKRTSAVRTTRSWSFSFARITLRGVTYLLRMDAGSSRRRRLGIRRGKGTSIPQITVPMWNERNGLLLESLRKLHRRAAVVSWTSPSSVVTMKHLLLLALDYQITIQSADNPQVVLNLFQSEGSKHYNAQSLRFTLEPDDIVQFANGVLQIMFGRCGGRLTLCAVTWPDDEMLRATYR